MKNKKYISIIILFLLCTIYYGCNIEFPENRDSSNISDYSENSGSENGNPLSVGDNRVSSSDISQTEIFSKDTVSAEISTESLYQNENPPLLASSEPEQGLYCTISVDCLSIFDNIDKFNKNKTSYLPENGVILNEKKIEFFENETVADVLIREMENNRIHLDFVRVPISNNIYIKGINNIYEFDCGGFSGWKYSVNGEYPGIGCGQYKLENGDVIEWKYSISG